MGCSAPTKWRCSDRCLFKGLSDRFGDIVIADLTRRARPGFITEAIKTTLGKAARSLVQAVGIFAKTRDDLLVLQITGSQEHDLGPPRQTLRRLSTTHQRLQLTTLLVCSSILTAGLPIDHASNIPNARSNKFLDQDTSDRLGEHGGSERT